MEGTEYHQIEQAHEAVRSFISSIQEIPENEWNNFKERLTYECFEKGSVVTKKGMVENKVYFLLAGMVRVFAPIDGSEHSTNFRFQGQFTSSITSFISRKPSLYVVEALSDIEAFSLKYDDVQELYANCPNVNTLGRKIIEGLYIEKHNREISFLSQSAENRYLQMVEHQPKFIHHIPLKHIASYLGVSPETISRIRSKQL